MSKDFEGIIIDAIKEAVPKIEEYRKKNKYKHDEEAILIDEVRSYEKMERYKNRVRIVDIILPLLRTIVVKYSEVKRIDGGRKEID